MTRPGPNRPAAVSEPLAAELRKYLRFRHVFRYAYNVQLRWEEMAELVSACQGVLEQLEAEMDAFLKATEGRQ